MENNTCGIKQNIQLAELMWEVQLIIWDEAPMTQRYAFEALDMTLRDTLGFKNTEKGTKFLAALPSCSEIVTQTYPDFTSRQTDDEYLKERAILTPRNDDAEAINKFMFKQLSGEPVTYYSADEICKASTDNIDQHQLYPIEFLNSLNFPGMPPHALWLKKNYQSCSYEMSIQAKAYAMELD
ncbi:ATP-dependent DNA helicase PIF1-like protein [Tanacetum coccineum]